MESHILPTDLIPPPPLPPPTVGSIRDGTKQASHDLPQLTSITEEGKKACATFFHLKGLSADVEHEYLFVFSNYPVQPVLQTGPMCGMVALAMASSLVEGSSVTAEEILLEAKKQGWSFQGEMFSAQNLQKLAAHFLSCPTECVQVRPPGSHDSTALPLDQFLFQRSLILIPYDADKNHSPCLRQGHKAHWALLTGFLVAFKSSVLPKELSSWCSRDPECPALYYWPSNPSEAWCDKMTELVDREAAEVLVLARHGKSRHVGLWPVSDLLLSNDNLVDVGPERHEAEYVLPEGGLKVGLRSRAIIIDRSSNR